ncbi:hypothetical protein NPIL_519911 [Nephila pilipes]|uniref:Uncharacterized protein n=1 Tax=Nephila pilipes TaxID=299642 RepID=A0A8X6NRX2_NEPPI|nr:hypothetical protein NPIL_519911 [Nephila pilipes]
MESSEPENEPDKELETMDTDLENTIDHNSRNQEECLIRTRLEEKFREAINNYHYHSMLFNKTIVSNIAECKTPPPYNTGAKIKASEKEDFKTPTKTTKQPRTENKFTLPISNPFEALNKKTDEIQDLPTTQEKEKVKEDKVPSGMMHMTQNYNLILQEEICNRYKNKQENQEELTQENSKS